MQKINILISPAHYYLDDRDSGSELSWVSEILKRINKSRVYFLHVITGYKKNFKSNYRYFKIYEIDKSPKNNLTLLNSLLFTLKKTISSKNILLNNNIQIIHHMLPFGIGLTFDIDFILNNKNKKYIIGPIQSSQRISSSEEYNYAAIGFSVPKIYRILKRLDKWLVKLFGLFTNYLCNLTLKKADRVIVINHFTKKIIMSRQISENKIIIIPPGIDSKKFIYKSLNNKSKDKYEIINVGYLIKRKGIDLVIQAMVEVVKKNKNVRFRIIGDGPQLQSLKELVNKLNLNKYVLFQGFVPNSEISKYYQKAHIFVNMSKSEGFATVCLEAMASGLAIISSRVGGFSDAITDGVNGFLVKQGDYKSLAEKILLLLENKYLLSQFGERARKEAEEKYDWDKVIIPQYLKIYKSLVENE